ncbi:MAG: creatininase family protein [Actinomycetota bacterium]|nr:creatininase family protein [Actinomycetota bacterium]
MPLAPRLLEELTWPELAALLEAGEDLCLLPVGATEQHGRHLPVGTDTMIADAVCRDVSARTGVPLLPMVAISSSQAHTRKWPGTLALPPRLLIAAVVEVARWVRASGFARLLIFNAHVGNAAPLGVAVDEIRQLGDLRVGLLHWYDLTPEIAALVTDDAVDWHGHRSETALMLHLRPELVRREEIRDDSDRTAGLVFSYTVAETSREGVTGSPSLATAEEGARLFALVSAALVERIERARSEAPPSL